MNAMGMNIGSDHYMHSTQINPVTPMTLVHAGLYPFLILFIIGAVIQVSWGGEGGGRGFQDCQ